MVATPLSAAALATPQITWETLPDRYILPDDPVDNIYQPLLAEALRDGLETIGLITENTLISTNYGICATIDGTIVVKAPDWAYIPNITVPRSDVLRSYTPQLQGDLPVIVMEFLSDTDGGEYSSRPTPPIGKWFFYEQILKIPTYVIFDIDGGLLEVYRRGGERYFLEQPDENGRHWIAEMGLFLGTWRGQREDRSGYWLRWWTADGQLLPWSMERATQAQAKAEQSEAKAEQAEAKAEQAEARADRLAAYLRANGVDPDALT
jgi:Uma2 family endonuclease